MNMEEYRGALAKGKKFFRSCVSKGAYPYLQVLDDILENSDIISTVELGVVNIPAAQIVGTKTEGRKTAFAPNFMPLLGETTEFARKWQALCDSHLQEGIRDPILAYEFMNRFYVQEGNKRVSVLKYFGAASIPGKVIRLVPRRNESRENRIYYEFMDFYRLTGVNYLWFSHEGSFARLVKATGKAPGEVWDEDERSMLFSVYLRFAEAFNALGGEKLGITPADAMLAYAKVYPYETVQQKSVAEIKKDLSQMWIEIRALAEDSAVELSMEPSNAAPAKPSLIEKLFTPEITHLKVGFIHEKSAETSGWTYSHEFGRRQLELAFPDKVETVCYDNVQVGVDDLDTIQRAIDEGCDVLFTTTPKLMDASLKMAVKHPNVHILNCSINMSHPYIRTYYGRIHEAKFIVGAIAGALAEDNRIGYVATYPTFGMTAGINAFALGAQMVNPRARVYLEWTAVKGVDIDRSFAERGVSLVSSQDMRNPNNDSCKYGLYRIAPDGTVQDIAMPFWHWGEFYVRIIQSIFNGTWENEDGDARAINYWWGMASGVVDVLLSRSLPQPTRRLVQLLRRTICTSEFDPFAGVRGQDDTAAPFSALGTDGQQELKKLSPDEVIRMDWLADNVVGSIPTLDQLIEEAKPLVQLQGVNRQDIAPRIL